VLRHDVVARRSTHSSHLTDLNIPKGQGSLKPQKARLLATGLVPV
jgi:hypothetical protein